MTFELETIAAPATALGRGALAIVRLDGPRAHSILSLLIRKEIPPERMATHVRMFDEAGEIDEGVAVPYFAPRSFTGNDLVELTVHGSPAIVARLLEAAVGLGARIALPGEFSERAVLNGKIDLIQAEAIGRLVESRTALQAAISLSNLEGELSRSALDLRGRILGMLARVDAALDFADEDEEFIHRRELLSGVDEALKVVEQLLATFERGSAADRGLSLVLLGRPNVGKSTLLNVISGSERAIVTPVAGTTRDLIRETVELGGLPVTIIDTAGLRETSEEVEAIGISRSRAAAVASDLVVYLIDATVGRLARDEEELAALRDPLVVYSKCDLASVPAGELGISALSAAGIEPLLSRLDGLIREVYVPAEGSAVVVTARQRRSLEATLSSLTAASAAVRDQAADEILSVDLRHAADALGELVGIISRGDVLAEIFSKFCIGK